MPTNPDGSRTDVVDANILTEIQAAMALQGARRAAGQAMMDLRATLAVHLSTDTAFSPTFYFLGF